MLDSGGRNGKMASCWMPSTGIGTYPPKPPPLVELQRSPPGLRFFLPRNIAEQHHSGIGYRRVTFSYGDPDFAALLQTAGLRTDGRQHAAVPAAGYSRHRRARRVRRHADYSIANAACTECASCFVILDWNTNRAAVREVDQRLHAMIASGKIQVWRMLFAPGPRFTQSRHY